jgi:hypothetical protein
MTLDHTFVVDDWGTVRLHIDQIVHSHHEDVEVANDRVVGVQVETKGGVINFANVSVVFLIVIE